MIAPVVKDYDDENIIEDCEAGWSRFCREVLVRTYYYMTSLCRRHRRLGRYGMEPSTRQEWEMLLREVAAYRWVVDGTGGEFTFEQTCRDIGLDPTILRRRLLSMSQPRRDINLLVAWVVSQQEKHRGKGRRQDQADCGLGTSIVPRVRDFRSQVVKRSSRRGAQTHAVCRHQDGDAD